MAIMRVARGFEEICGRARNSSRSMVPELSWFGLAKVPGSVYIVGRAPCPAS
jgi:hypothetical protein